MNLIFSNRDMKDLDNSYILVYFHVVTNLLSPILFHFFIKNKAMTASSSLWSGNKYSKWSTNRNDTRIASTTAGMESDTIGGAEVVRIPTNTETSERPNDPNNNPIKPIQHNNDLIGITVTPAGSIGKIEKILIKTQHDIKIVGFNAAEIFLSYESYAFDVGEAPHLDREISKKIIARNRVHVDDGHGQGAFNLKQQRRSILSRAKPLQSEVESPGAASERQKPTGAIAMEINLLEKLLFCIVNQECREK